MQNTYKTTGIVLVILGIMAVFNILVDLAFWRIILGIIVLGTGLFLAFKQPGTEKETNTSRDYPEEHSHVLCEACSSSLPEGSAYCSKCGTKL